MTNDEEKAIELVKQFQSCMNIGVSMDAAVMSCLMEMAEWKDKEFAEERREILQQAYDSANKTNEAVAELVRERIRTDIKQRLTEHGLELELEDILDLI